MSEFVGYILANVERMDESMRSVQRSLNKLARNNKYILIGSMACLGLGLVHGKQIHELKNSLNEIRKDVNSIQMRIGEG